MSIRSISVIISFLFPSAGVCDFAAGDTLGIPMAQFRCTLAGSFLNEFKGSSVIQNSLLLITKNDYDLLKSGDKYSHILKAGCELGFTAYMDSVFVKHSDKVNIHYIHKSGPATLSRSASFQFVSSLLHSYDYVFNSATGKTDRVRTGSVLCPAETDFGYGVSYLFGNNSLINISLATARFTVKPEYLLVPDETRILLARSGKKLLYFDYGFSLQYYVIRKLNSFVSINFTGKAFIKSLKKDQYEFESSNILSVKITKTVEVKLESKWIYLPVTPYNLRVRNELLIGLYFGL